ncbi:MAG TPA: 2-amino-4-hydroxy-6-hydroxymethyldihydropteridine diphosphokinase [Nitrospirota bacterium]|nr:2-amino-4-hydroxy-6-hydroxymethyldihydropteridine diphosphokinase [Nitrospirota bacterium]
MTRAFIGVGSNIEPAKNTEKAIRMLARETQVVGVSMVYLTEAEGRTGQPPYYNCVVEIETDLPPAELKHRILRGIEAMLGRIRTEDKYADRTIDLDLLLYDDLAMASGDLTLPDPDIVRRPFLAVPLRELIPGSTLPGTGLCIDDIAASLAGNPMKPLANYTEQIRKDILHDRKQGTGRDTSTRAAR